MAKTKIELLNEKLKEKNNEVIAIRQEILRAEHEEFDWEGQADAWYDNNGMDKKLFVFIQKRMHEIEILMTNQYSKGTITKICKIFEKIDDKITEVMGNEWYEENASDLQEYFLDDLDMYNPNDQSGNMPFNFSADDFYSNSAGFIYWESSSARC